MQKNNRYIISYISKNRFKAHCYLCSSPNDAGMLYSTVPTEAYRYKSRKDAEVYLKQLLLYYSSKNDKNYKPPFFIEPV